MFLEMLQQRRSIRKYLQQTIEPQIIAQLIEAALRAPSSRSLSPWEFVIVDQPLLLAQLAQSKQYGSSFLQNAPLGIIICADPECCDVWIEDASIAATYIQLMAESIGLGSCWIQIRERMGDPAKTAEEFVKETLGIPGRLKVEAIISIGFAAEKLPPHRKEELNYQKVFYNEYGCNYNDKIGGCIDVS